MEMVRFALFLSAGLVAFGQGAGRIEGRVVNASGAPLEKATVTLSRASGTPSPGSVFLTSQATIAETGSDGRFSFANLEPSQYSLRVARSGYAPLERFRTFFIEPGIPPVEFTFVLTPQAVITGRITDSDGDPLENAGVSAFRDGDERDRKQWIPIGSSRTDSQGNFRIGTLPPGRYFIAAGSRNYGVTTYYQSSWDMAGAAAITVEPGSDRSGIDIRVRPDGPPRFTVRGKASMISGGSVAAGQMLTLNSRDGLGSGGTGGSVRDDGSFEIKGVRAGTYLLQTVEAFGGSNGMVSSSWTDKGQVEVIVTDHDEVGVLIAIRPALTIAGIVTMEDGAKLTVRPSVVLIPHDLPFNGPDAWARVREDGSFEIRNLGPVLYDIQPAALPAGTMVKSIRFNGRDATHAPIDLTGGSEGRLEIVLSKSATN